MSKDDDIRALMSAEELADIDLSDDDLMNEADEIPEDELDDDVLWVDSEDEANEDEGDDEPEAAEDDEPEAEPEEEEAQAEPEAPAEPIPDVAAINEKIDALKQQRKDLRAQYEDGDLTEDQLDEQIEALNEKQADLIADRKMAEKQTEQAQTAFMNDVNAYFDKYPDLRNEDVLAGLDAMFQTVNSQKAHAGKSTAQRLELAHKMLIASAGDELAVPPIAEAKPKGKAKAAKPKADPMRKAPPTLAKVPTAGPGTESDFAGMDVIMERGTPEQIEAALGRMSPAERDAWLADM